MARVTTAVSDGANAKTAMVATRTRRATALAVALALGACGGGSGSGDEDPGVPLGGGGVVPLGTGDEAPAGGGAIDASALDGAAVAADDDPAAGDGPERAGPPGGFATAPGVEACSVEDLKARVDFDMRDYYVFADRVPSLSPAEFETPQALIEALRVDPDIFSSVSDFDDFRDQSAGRTAGFGFRLDAGEGGLPAFRLVIGGSPAAAAGIERGDALVALGGEPVGDLGAEGIVARLRDAAEGEAVRFGLERAGERLEIEVVKAAYTIDTLAGAFSFEADDGTRVGYVPVLQFAESTPEAMDETFARLAAEGVEALVLALRYNPGGLIFAASRLAAHVAGERVADETFVQYLFNDAYARELNASIGFEEVETTLGLERVVAILTGESASASELAVNGLAPFVDVEVVGTPSFGKAFGSSPQRYCDIAINAMAFVTANAEGTTVAGGIRPGCTVEDAWAFPLGDARDALTGAAYEVLLDGTCPGDALAGVPAGPSADGTLAVRTRAGAAAPLWDELPRGPGAIDVR